MFMLAWKHNNGGRGVLVSSEYMNLLEVFHNWLQYELVNLSECYLANVGGSDRFNPFSGLQMQTMDGYKPDMPFDLDKFEKLPNNPTQFGYNRVHSTNVQRVAGDGRYYVKV